MREEIIFSGALIVVLTAIFVLLSFITEDIRKQIAKSKEKDFKKISIAYKKGDKKAALELKEQLVFLEKKVEEYTYKAETAREELERFKIIYQCFDIETDQGIMTVEIPSNITNFSYSGEDQEHVYICGEKLEELKTISKESNLHNKENEQYASFVKEVMGSSRNTREIYFAGEWLDQRSEDN